MPMYLYNTSERAYVQYEFLALFSRAESLKGRKKKNVILSEGQKDKRDERTGRGNVEGGRDVNGNPLPRSRCICICNVLVDKGDINTYVHISTVHIMWPGKRRANFWARRDDVTHCFVPPHSSPPDPDPTRPDPKYVGRT